MVLSKDLKIAICFGLIMGVILSLCNLCFATESETVTTGSVSGIYIDYRGNTFQENSSASVGYFLIEPGYTYYIKNNSPTSNRDLATSDIIPSAGGSYTYITSILPNGTYSFQSSQFGYIYFDYSWNTYVTVTREPIEGMTNFVDNIAYSLSIGNLSGVWILAVPIIAISVLLGLGFYLLKRLLNKIKRAKGGA